MSPRRYLAGRGTYRTDPRLAALFASADHVLETFGHDPSIIAFLEGVDGRVERIATLLLADRTGKKVLGMELKGEMLRRVSVAIACWAPPPVRKRHVTSCDAVLSITCSPLRWRASPRSAGSAPSSPANAT